MKTCPISSCANTFIQETSRYRTLTFQSQVSFTSGKSRRSWYQSKRFVSRQTKYIVSRRSAHIFSLHFCTESHARFFSGVGKGGEERRRVAFYADSAGVLSRFRFRAERKTRAGPWIRAKRYGKREQPCFISRLQTSSLPRGGSGDARASGRDYRGFLEAVGTAIASATVVAALLDGYTSDILPDNGRSGSHWSEPPFA